MLIDQFETVEFKRKEYLQEIHQSRIPIPMAENVKRVKLSPEPINIRKPNNSSRKSKGSPKKSVLSETGNIPPSSEIKPPSSDRFMITPSLPGIRSAIPQEKISVKEMLAKFGHKYQTSTTQSSEEITDNSSQYESNHQEDVVEEETVKISNSNWFPAVLFIVTMTIAGAIVHFYNQYTSDNNLLKIYGGLAVAEISHLYGESASIASELSRDASIFFENIAQKAHGFVKHPSIWEKIINRAQSVFHLFITTLKQMMLNFEPIMIKSKEDLVSNYQKVNVYVNGLLEKGLAESCSELATIVEDYTFYAMMKLSQGFKYAYSSISNLSLLLYNKLTNEHWRTVIQNIASSTYDSLRTVKDKVSLIMRDFTVKAVIAQMSNMMPEKIQLSISGLLLVTGVGFISLAYLLSA